jgi:hypothetical protein
MSSYLKNLYQIAALVSMAAFLCSCYKNVEIEVRLIGEVRARRTFASIQSINDEKERERYIEMQEKSNPTIGYESDSISKYLILQFERFGLVENGELLLKGFQAQTDSSTQFIDNTGKSLQLQYFYDSITGHTHFKLSYLKDSIIIDTGAYPLQNLDYAFIDVIPGGNKELVFLNDYYIMNGFNFDFQVYEIKIKK